MILQKNVNGKVGSVNFMGTMVITPEIAKKMLEKNFVNRKINKRRVHTYSFDMKNGNWGGVIDGLSLQFDKDENLLNGQHRLNAIIDSGVSLEMFIFQTDFTANSLELPFDTGLNRSLALIMKKSSNYVGVVNGFITIGTTLNRCTPSMFTSFEDSLTSNELDFFEKISNSDKVGFSAGIKVGFLMYYFNHEFEQQSLLNLWKGAINSDYENPMANELRDFANKTREWGGGNYARNKRAIYTYGILNGIPKRKYSDKKFEIEFHKLISEFMKGRI